MNPTIHKDVIQGQFATRLSSKSFDDLRFSTLKVIIKGMLRVDAPLSHGEELRGSRALR